MAEDTLQKITEKIIAGDHAHARWLNTLSMMENTGARKISRYEHPVSVNITILKHAAEEARHAYYLKKQIEKLGSNPCPDYSYQYLLTPVQSHHYLNNLDVRSSRYAKDVLHLSGRDMKHIAYLLVTYSIEVRADMLYGIYQDALTKAGSRVTVKSIIAEEEGHLQEMQRMMEESLPSWESHAAHICNYEHELFQEWLIALSAELKVA